MTATYTDILDAMIEAQERGLDVEKVVLSDASMNTFLTDDKFTEADEERQKEELGEEWTLEVEEGDSDFLVASGEEISL